MELHFKIRCDESNIRLDRYLVSVFPDISRSKIQTVIKSNALQVDGAPVKPSQILTGGEKITCDYYRQPEDEIIPQPIELNILYEDDDIVVINKQAGLVVHPGSGNWDNTLVNGLIYRFKSLSNSGTERPGIVHRLDKDTSGVIIIAKNEYSHYQLSRQFMNREIQKEYRALVWGLIRNPGIIEGNIGRHPKNRQIFASVNSGGRRAVTRYEPLEVFSPLTWMSVFPETGRTHQIRVHMKEMGHPIIQDRLYGGDFSKMKSYHEKYTRLVKSVSKVITRTALHAYSIKIRHPREKEKRTFIAELPSDIKSALDILSHDK